MINARSGYWDISRRLSLVVFLDSSFINCFFLFLSFSLETVPGRLLDSLSQVRTLLKDDMRNTHIPSLSYLLSSVILFLIYSMSLSWYCLLSGLYPPTSGPPLHRGQLLNNSTINSSKLPNCTPHAVWKYTCTVYT